CPRRPRGRPRSDWPAAGNSAPGARCCARWGARRFVGEAMVACVRPPTAQPRSAAPMDSTGPEPVHQHAAELALHDWPLPYEERLAERRLESIELVVVHCTETPDLEIARQFGERALYASGTGNSGHYYIDRDGSVHVFVRP